MTYWSLLPLTIGFCIVLQGVLNRQFAANSGLTLAALINALILGLLCVSLFAFAWMQPGAVPESLQPKLSTYQFYLWHLVPGLAGFIIVFCTPMSIRVLGAAQTYILVITAQILFSSIWDQWNQTTQFSTTRILGLLLVLLGSSLFTLAK